MSSAVSDEQFIRLFEDFLAKVRPLNYVYRKQVFQNTMNTLGQIVHELKISGAYEVPAEEEPAPVVEMSLEDKILAGVDKMRTKIHTITANTYHIFQNLRNGNGEVTVENFVDHFYDLGFPVNIATRPQLIDFVSRYSTAKVGLLNYGEFLTVLGLKDPDNPESRQVDFYRVLTECLAKLNNANLRAIFRNFDNNADGILSMDEMIMILQEWGLAVSVAKNPAFAEFLKQYSKRGMGDFAYSDFLKVVNVRLDNASVVPRQVTPISEEMSPAEIFDLLNRECRNLSVEAILKKFDVDEDGVLDEIEFVDALLEMGYTLNGKQLKEIFSCFDAHDGHISLFDFVKTVQNPGLNPKLNTRMARSINGGGISHIPIGNIASSFSAPAYVERPAIKVTQDKNASSIGVGNIPVTETDPLHTGIKVLAHQLSSSVKITDDIEPIEQHVDPSRRPPGGFTSVSFVADHGAAPLEHRNIEEAKIDLLAWKPEVGSPPAKSSRPVPAAATSSFALHYDENSPADTTRKQGIAIKQAPGGQTNIVFTEFQQVEFRPSLKPIQPPPAVEQEQRILVRPAQPPGGKRSDEIQIAKTGIKFTGTPGGKTSISLTDLEGSANLQPQFQDGALTNDDQLVLNRISEAIYGFSPKLRDVYTRFNISQAPTLSRNDFQTALRKMCHFEVKDNDLNSLMSKFDQDGDGNLTYSEFVRMLTNQQ